MNEQQKYISANCSPEPSPYEILVAQRVMRPRLARLLAGVMSVEEAAAIGRLTPNRAFNRLAFRGQTRLAWLLYSGMKPIEAKSALDRQMRPVDACDTFAVKEHRHLAAVWVDCLANGPGARHPRAASEIVVLPTGQFGTRDGYEIAKPLQWLAWHLELPYELFGRLRSQSSAVVTWLARKHKNRAMTKRRIARSPDGEPVEYCYLDRIDELRPQHVLFRLNAAPDEVYRTIHLERLAISENWYGEDVELPPPPFKAPLPLRPIETSKGLWHEGREMHHCVCSHTDACLRGTSAIYTVEDRAGRSTLEIARLHVGAPWRLKQHHGVCNTRPPESHIELVGEWVRSIGIASDVVYQECGARRAGAAPPG